MIGADEWNGTVSQLQTFRAVTGVTFPLLLQAGIATGGNLATLYGTYDNYVVINRQGIVRYHAALTWPHGNRYHLNEIRGSVDTLVTSPLGIGPGAGTTGRFSLAPNPFTSAIEIEWELPVRGSAARFSVFDLSGRLVRELEPRTTSGLTRATWDGRDASSMQVRPGVYLVRATAGGRALVRRVVRLR